MTSDVEVAYARNRLAGVRLIDAHVRTVIQPGNLAGIPDALHLVVGLDTDVLGEQRVVALVGAVEDAAKSADVHAVGVQLIGNLGQVFPQVVDIGVGLEGEELGTIAVVHKDAVAQALGVEEVAVNVGAGQGEEEHGVALLVTAVDPLIDGGIGRHGGNGVDNLGKGHRLAVTVQVGKLDEGHDLAVAIDAHQARGVAPLGEVGGHVTLAVKQVQTVLVEPEVDFLGVIVDLEVQAIAAVVVLVGKGAAPHELDAILHVLVIVDILARGDGDEA